jgi:hypothetical protein
MLKQWNKDENGTKPRENIVVSSKKIESFVENMC